MPADDAGILRAAETDHAHAQRLLTEHVRTCRNLGCGKCESLTAHVGRCEQQVGLLTPAQPEMQELF